ncbi:MAG: type VI secretion system baseplate subunit TssF [Victivallales bacterium]|nr:type VI secretion system baseplate subunit TssF [Victivallales bacterium]
MPGISNDFLKDYYEGELEYLRHMGGEFAHQYPKIAHRLGLDSFQCADPYVERLLEGVAFLTARIHHKLDREFPKFTDAFLEALFPQYLQPVPSMGIAQFQVDPDEQDLAAGVTLPAGSMLRSLREVNEQTFCQFTTGTDLVLWPLEVVDARYYSNDVGALGLPSESGVKAAVSITLEVPPGLTAGQLELDRLPLFIRSGSLEMATRLYELLFAHCHQVVVRTPGDYVVRKRSETILPSECLRQCGFADDEALVPHDERTFSGFRLLREYFSLPERFLFFEVDGLRPALQKLDSERIELVFVFDANDHLLGRQLRPETFVTNCVPVINSFPKQIDNVHVSAGKADFHVVADRTRPADFEVLSLTQVKGYAGAGETVLFRPFYSSDAFHWDSEGGHGQAYYTLRREARRLSATETERGPRTSYLGGEVFLSMVDAAAPPFGNVSDLSLKGICSNRDLPLLMSLDETGDFSLDVSAPVLAIRCIVGPTAPRPSLAGKTSDWRVLNHLATNYLSLVNADRGEAAGALREILALYGDVNDPAVRRQIDGLVEVSSEPVIRRLAAAGPVAFGRGLAVKLTFSENAFPGAGVFLLGTILARFLSRYVSINSFVETVLCSLERGTIMHWPARPGEKPVL